MSSDNGTVELENSLLGKMKVSSSNINLLFTILGCIVGVVTAVLLYFHMLGSRQDSKEFTDAMRQNAQATREQNCLITFPQEKRESNAGLCKQMSR